MLQYPLQPPINLLEPIHGIAKIKVECMMKGILLFSIFSLSVAVAACSGGDSGSSNGSSPSAASTERIVYLADQDIDDVFELYLAGSSIKLNPPLSQGKNVLDFQITPDKTAVVYRADHDTNDVFELYRVEFAKPGVSTKLNSPLPVGGDVWSVVITPDSSSVLYVADQTTDGVSELYRVPVATPGVSTKLNGPLVPGGNVFFDIGTTPDNSAVVYRATQATANTIELYRVPLATPGLSTKLNGALPPNADVTTFKITPNGTLVAYTVLQRIIPSNPPGGTDFLEELNSVAFATPGQSTKLSGPVGPSGALGPSVFVGQYDITPDSFSVVYLLAGASDDVRFLYRVPFATPGQSTQLIVASSSNTSVEGFAIRPDSSGVVFETKLFTLRESPELFLISFATPGVSTKLNGPLVAGGRIQNENGATFAITPDNSSVVYVADETTQDVIEIYRVPFATPGVSTKLNGPLGTDRTLDLQHFFGGEPPAITPDSSAVVYRASQTTAGVFELYRVPFATPTVSTKLNGPLTSGGDVTRHIVQ
jgi:hypothetical protein